MDVKTAITLQQKARKKALAGGCPGGATNVNDMRYSCQGFMGRHRSVSASGGVGRTRGVSGGIAPYAEEGPCAFTHCIGEVYHQQGVAGGIAPYAEEGPCAFTHCMGCGYQIAVTAAEAEAIAGGFFPPVCDSCAPCMNQSTCTPCEGPQRAQRWGTQFTPDDFGGRMCFRPCPPDPCRPDVPPVDDQIPELPPPVRKQRPKPPPRMKKPPKLPPARLKKKDVPKCPDPLECCVVLMSHGLFLTCADTNSSWHGMNVTNIAECTQVGGTAICKLHWTDECGEHWLDLPLCSSIRPGVPTVPPIITAPKTRPSGVPTVPPIITAPKTRPSGVPTVPPVFKVPPTRAKPPYIPVPAKPGSPTPRLALAGYSGRVRSPSNGVGRR
jgi:hypothetical protein